MEAPRRQALCFTSCSIPTLEYYPEVVGAAWRSIVRPIDKSLIGAFSVPLVKQWAKLFSHHVGKLEEKGHCVILGHAISTTRGSCKAI